MDDHHRIILDKYHSIIESHAKWLNRFDQTHQSRWKSQLSGKDYEAAVAEAYARHILCHQVDDIVPHEIPGVGGFDFHCISKKSPQSTFFIEVSNLDTMRTAEKTELPISIDDWHGGFVKQSTEYLLWRKRQQKSKQILKQRVAFPVIVMFTSFHETASTVHFGQSSVESLLKPATQWRVNVSPDYLDKESESWEEPIFQNGMFFKYGATPHTYTDACPEISAIMLAGIPWIHAGDERHAAYLALNPTAVCPFDPQCLPQILCCKLSDGWEEIDPCLWKTEWIQ